MGVMLVVECFAVYSYSYWVTRENTAVIVVHEAVGYTKELLDELTNWKG